MKKNRRLKGLMAFILALLMLGGAVCFTSAANTPRLGDVNADGNINSIDALMILQCSVGQTKLDSAQKKAADVNADGGINSIDALDVLRFSIGLISSFSGEIADIPSYDTVKTPSVKINNGVPQFTAAEKKTVKSFEKYSDLDSLGRCGVALACLAKDTMPTGERGSIGQVKPSGWQTIKFDFIDGKYLYNRCHLIGWQLSAENANVKNLITGTRYLNVSGMLPYENMVADYIKETNHHVMYRVTPVFIGSELVARGVKIEAYSVEDNGSGISFNVYCYNVQPGVKINYADGTAVADGTDPCDPAATEPSLPAGTVVFPEDRGEKQIYVVNISTNVYHLSTCASVKLMSDKNKQTVFASKDYLENQMKYKACERCHP